MFLHQTHGAGGGNSSVMVEMLVCLCLASKKPSKRELFVPPRTDLAVKLLTSINSEIDRLDDGNVLIAR